MKAIQMIKSTFTDRTFLRKAMAIALPVALQNLLNSVVSMVDNIMIGELGETSIAAVGLANQVFFIYNIIVFGVCSGSGVLLAQFFGKGDYKRFRNTTGIGLSLVLMASMIFVIPGIFAPQVLMGFFTNLSGTIAEGSAYLRIVIYSYPLIAISNLFAASLRAANRVKGPMYISIITIFLNVILNYIFIFGNFGAPALGVEGAAIATLSARGFEVIAILILVYLKKTPAALRLRDILSPEPGFLKMYFKTTWPVILNEFMWGLGTTLYSVAYGHMGDMAVVAINIAATITNLMTVFFWGISTATAVILGNEMGAGHLKVAEDYGRKFLILQVGLSVIAAAIIVAIAPAFISIYNVTDMAKHLSWLCCIVFAIYMPFKMFNTVNVVGILRSGGDTKFCLFLDCAGVWTIAVPLAFLGGLVWNLPIYVVYAMVLSEEVFKLLVGLWRYRKKVWLKNLTVNEKTT